MKHDLAFTRLQFGLAQGDITPPVGIYHRMWGAATHDRAEGIHRPLTASAITLRPLSAAHSPADERQKVLIAIDHCLLLPREMETLVNHVERAAGVARGELIVTFSHTHAAGLMDCGRAELPGGELIAPYLDSLAKKIADLVTQAIAELRPVTITYTIGRCAMAAHRDLFDSERNLWVCGFNPHAPADDTLIIGRVTDSSGRPIATLVNYACHPTTLAWENRLISPDYPGAMRELVENATGAPCVFVQGASGDLGPRDGYVADVEVADRNGRQLGYAVLAALESLPPTNTSYEYQGPVISGATIGVWQHQPRTDAENAAGEVWKCKQFKVELPYRADLPTLEATRTELDRWRDIEQRGQSPPRDARAMVERLTRQTTRLAALPPGKSYPYSVTLLRLGRAVWLTVEGEPYNLLARSLRAAFPEIPILIAVLANGWRPAYLPTADTYGKGIYQESIAVLAPGSLETLIDAIESEIRSIVA
jgi:hypothetical protein